MKAHVVIGTRPEAIKLAPVVWAFNHFPQSEVKVVLSGQHTDLLSPFLVDFLLPAWKKLEISESELVLKLGSINQQLFQVWQKEKPHVVIVQGDTTTAMMAALTAAYLKIPVAHVEAGLRTYNMDRPFPEEMNRQIISRVASWHFVPTKKALNQLNQENVSGRIHLVGNTVVDAIQWTKQSSKFQSIEDKYDIVVTGHRRENIADLQEVCSAINTLAKDHSVLWIEHPNPEVKAMLDRHLPNSIKRTSPVDYFTMAGLMHSCKLLITDSGGLQEEAPSWGVPVVVTRDETERPELIESGLGILTGTDQEKILQASKELLESTKRESIKNPFGDGLAGFRIAEILHHQLNLS
ncbi:MAG: UDP-N-acetylglucosamine 2-epimerase (non-hydrolyzing) [Flavobacteriales bacterium]|nr:UDP-N-acetylglucosamine 2-epimerase (non-hydrolyzing) [Flavobacteriales bacterium]